MPERYSKMTAPTSVSATTDQSLNQHTVHRHLRLLFETHACNICHEVLLGPVKLPCDHIFCSLCIRRCLTDKSLCPHPHCSTSVTSNHLVPLYSLDAALEPIRNALSTTVSPIPRTHHRGSNHSNYLVMLSAKASGAKALLGEKCRTNKLPWHGTVNELAERYNEFVIRWNANLDLASPLSKEAVLSAVTKRINLKATKKKPSAAAVGIGSNSGNSNGIVFFKKNTGAKSSVLSSIQKENSVDLNIHDDNDGDKIQPNSSDKHQYAKKILQSEISAPGDDFDILIQKTKARKLRLKRAREKEEQLLKEIKTKKMRHDNQQPLPNTQLSFDIKRTEKAATLLDASENTCTSCRQKIPTKRPKTIVSRVCTVNIAPSTPVPVPSHPTSARKGAVNTPSQKYFQQQQQQQRQTQSIKTALMNNGNSVPLSGKKIPAVGKQHSTLPFPASSQSPQNHQRHPPLGHWNSNNTITPTSTPKKFNYRTVTFNSTPSPNGKWQSSPQAHHQIQRGDLPQSQPQSRPHQLQLGSAHNTFNERRALFPAPASASHTHTDSQYMNQPLKQTLTPTKTTPVMSTTPQKNYHTPTPTVGSLPVPHVSPMNSIANALQPQPQSHSQPQSQTTPQRQQGSQPMSEEVRQRIQRNRDIAIARNKLFRERQERERLASQSPQTPRDNFNALQ